VDRQHRLVVEPRWVAPVAAAGVGYAVTASFTRPFTDAADVVTALPLAVAVVITAWSSLGSSPGGARRLGSQNALAAPWGRRWVVPLAPLVAVAGWELYCFFSLPRSSHPTLSSLIEILDSTRAGKIIGFAAWLALGWFVVAP
jgi:hypothetical protein